MKHRKWSDGSIGVMDRDADIPAFQFCTTLWPVKPSPAQEIYASRG
jgi:hypothetical protein